MKKVKFLTSLFTISCLTPFISLSSCSQQKEEPKRKVSLIGTTNADLTFTEDDTGMTIIYNMHYDNMTVLYANVSINGTKLAQDEYKLDVVSTIKNIFIARAILDKYPGDIVVDSKVEKKTVTSIEVKYNNKIHFQATSILLPNDILIKKTYNDKTSDKGFLSFNNNFILLKNEQPIDNFYENGYIFSQAQEDEKKVDFVVQYSADNVAALLTVPLSKLENPIYGVDLQTPSDKECYVTTSEDAKRLTGTLSIPEKLTINGIEKTVVGVASEAFYYSFASNIQFANPLNIKTIAEKAFCGSSITSFNMPKSVEEIKDKAFSTCYNLTSLTFEQDSIVTVIPVMCFMNCRSLTSIDLPKTINKIYRRAFVGCELLNSINIQYEGTKAWIVSGTSSQKINITSPTTNATNLKNTDSTSTAKDNWGYTGIEESTLPA